MGDFYELFFEDAQVASRELQITLTARDKERLVPMCGVPYHAADNYLSRLLRKGYRVAEFADCFDRRAQLPIRLSRHRDIRTQGAEACRIHRSFDIDGQLH
jgi:hypothetical protein